MPFALGHAKMRLEPIEQRGHGTLRQPASCLGRVHHPVAAIAQRVMAAELEIAVDNGDQALEGLHARHALLVHPERPGVAFFTAILPSRKVKASFMRASERAPSTVVPL